MRDPSSQRLRPSLPSWHSVSLVLLPALYKWVIGGLMTTCRTRHIGQEHERAMEEAGRRWIYVSWHNNTALAVWFKRNCNLAMMASSSKDGEYIARAISAVGNRPIRGSSSSQGGRAAREMIKAIRSGHNAAVTPDGPRGPKYRLQPGVLSIAALSGAALLPYHIEADRQWVLNTWDGHKIPKPFTTVYECIGDPFEVDREDLQRDPQALAALLEGRMMDNVARCQALSGQTPLNMPGQYEQGGERQ